jgi:hypothetical protein
VLGIIHRTKKDYVQAAKFYKGALRNDPPQKYSIMRDLATVQVHSRDMAGYLVRKAGRGWGNGVEPSGLTGGEEHTSLM